MRPLPDHVAMLDLETTGTDEHRDDIIEIGIVLCDRDLNELAARSWCVLPRSSVDEARAHAASVVRDMHDRNNLWGDLRLAEQYQHAPIGHTVTSVQTAVYLWLREQTGSHGQIALAGSGVSHFDRRFLHYQMPLVDGCFTYWALDVGVMRRMLQLAGREDLIPTLNDDKTHRALEDARLHLVEARTYCALLDTITRPVVPAGEGAFP